MSNKLMSTTSVAAIAIVTGLVTTALAPTAGAAEWGGFYLGAHVGAGEANWGGVYNNDDPTSTVFADRIDTDGILGGVHGGYNWQHGRTVFGIEGDWSFMDWDGVAQAVDSSESITGEVDNLASVRARIGVTIGHDQSVLLFATGGIAWADASALVCANATCSGSDAANFDFDDVGGVVGAGFEYAMTEQFRLRVDGSYYWFNDNKDLSSLNAGQPGNHLELEDLYTFRVGGTWYFTRKPQPVALK